MLIGFGRRWCEDVLQFATLCAIALSMINIGRISLKYTKAAISNRAVTSGITGLRKAYFVEKKTSGKHDFHNNSLRLFTFWYAQDICRHRAKENCESWAVACYRRLAHKSNNEKSDFYQVGLSVISYIGLCIRASESTFDRYPIFSSKTVEGITRESYRTVFS